MVMPSNKCGCAVWGPSVSHFTGGENRVRGAERDP